MTGQSSYTFVIPPDRPHTVVQWNPQKGGYDDDDNDNNNGNGNSGHKGVQDEFFCRYCCTSASLRTDWAQGDCVCTNCGVIHVQHVMDTGAEWRDYDNDDTQGMPSKARSGLIPTDETKYIGGLPPTTISKSLFGGPSNGFANIQKRLCKINQKIDDMMARQNKSFYRNEAMALRIKLNQHQKQQQQDDTTDAETVDLDVEPDYGSNHVWMEERDIEQHLREQEQRQHVARADKWSIERAKQVGCPDAVEESDDKNDALMLQAARDLYVAYQMLQQASHSMSLPLVITDEAAHIMSQYATTRDGIKVRGVSEATSVCRSSSSNNHHNKSEKINTMGRKRKRNEPVSLEEQQHKEQNKIRQTAALCAALLFWTSRIRQQPRSMIQICETLSSSVGMNIQRKHCSRAMAELKEHLPTWANQASTIQSSVIMPSGDISSNSNDTIHSLPTTIISISNFVEHTLSKLNLPPVAEAAVRYLVIRRLVGGGWDGSNNNKQQQNTTSIFIPTICTAMAYLVCCAGGVMQHLASQAQVNSDRERKHTIESKHNGTLDDNTDDDDDDEEGGNNVTKNENQMFDLFHERNFRNGTLLKEQQVYETQRMWDAWLEQLPWSRTLYEIEHSTSVSKNNVWELFRKELYPMRQEYLKELGRVVVVVPAVDHNKESNHRTNDNHGTANIVLKRERSLLQCTSLSQVLLSRIAAAAPLMKCDRKNDNIHVLAT